MTTRTVTPQSALARQPDHAGLAASAAPGRRPGLEHGAVLLTLSTVLVSAANYGLSLLLVHLLSRTAFAAYAPVSSVLLTVGTLASATVQWVIAREIAVSAPGSARRRGSVRGGLLLALGLAVPCAAAACGAAASYAGPALLVVLAAACLLILLCSAGAGYLQGRESFAGLAGLRVTEARSGSRSRPRPRWPAGAAPGWWVPSPPGPPRRHWPDCCRCDVI
ncbi:hypothetical protein GXW82_04100 [Streptacidiphilus sp. 4-A2]|nr:hypothetical protein [Streptacidiphilus sp. 4-A2]